MKGRHWFINSSNSNPNTNSNSNSSLLWLRSFNRTVCWRMMIMIWIDTMMGIRKEVKWIIGTYRTMGH